MTHKPYLFRRAVYDKLRRKSQPAGMLRNQPLPAAVRLLSTLLLLGPHSCLPGPVGALGTKQLLKPSAKHVKLEVVKEGLD